MPIVIRQKSTTGYFDDFSQDLMWHATYRAREMLMMQEQRLRHTFVLIVFVCHAAFFGRRNVLNSRKYDSTLTTTVVVYNSPLDGYGWLCSA